MKRNILFGLIILAAGSLLAADATPKAAPAQADKSASDSRGKDDVKAAAKKLAGTSNYSWRTTFIVPEGSPFKPGPIEGRTEKGGFTCLSMSTGDRTTESVLKGGGKGAVKLEGTWKSLAEAARSGEEGGFNPTRFLARILQDYRLPAAEAEVVTDGVKELKLADGVYAGDLTEECAKQLLVFRRRSGDQPGPEVSNPKGSARFWVKDGLLAKYEYKVQGTLPFNGNDMDVDRTTTVEMKDVGTTKLTVPEEAAKKAMEP